MAQDDVEQFLIKNPGKSFTAKELAQRFSLSTGTITMNARRMEKWGRIHIDKERKTGLCHYSLPTGHSYTKHINTKSDRR